MFPNDHFEVFVYVNLIYYILNSWSNMFLYRRVCPLACLTYLYHSLLGHRHFLKTFLQHIFTFACFILSVFILYSVIDICLLHGVCYIVLFMQLLTCYDVLLTYCKQFHMHYKIPFLSAQRESGLRWFSKASTFTISTRLLFTIFQ